MDSTTIQTQMRTAGPALATLAGDRIRPGVALGHPDLLIEQAERNKLVILDPACAAYIRGCAPVEAIQDWIIDTTDQWLITVPADTTNPEWSELQTRIPALARRLAPIQAEIAASGGRRSIAKGEPDPAPRLVVAGTPVRVAWDLSTRLVTEPAWTVYSAEPYWLALATSRPGRLWLEQGAPALADLPVPEVAAPTAHHLGSLALQAFALAYERRKRERGFLQRLLSDFGPPGRPATPRLTRWWELDFDALCREMAQELNSDIPEPYRPTLQQLHSEQQAAHADAEVTLSEIQAMIDGQVAALYHQ
jgi:hypothetical protein